MLFLYRKFSVTISIEFTGLGKERDDISPPLNKSQHLTIPSFEQEYKHVDSCPMEIPVIGKVCP